MPEGAAGTGAVATWCFGLLGELQISYAGQILPVPPHRTHGLLALFLLRPSLHRRARLGSALFPDLPEHHSRRRLSDLLWLLRDSLPELPLESSRSQVRLDPSMRWLDTEAFQHAASGTTLDDWLSALDLYRGELCPGLFDEWLLPEREALYLNYLRVAHRAGATLARKGHAEQALPILERLLHSEPYDEGALRALMRAYQALGRRGSALEAFERFESLAADELGTPPEAATIALAEALREHRVPSGAEDDRDAQNGQTPAALLRHGCAALARGDWGIVSSCITRLRADPTASEEETRLLELDLNLEQDDLTHAERLLAEAMAQDISDPALQARSAQLALARLEVSAAHDLAITALMIAHQARDGTAEQVALQVLAEAQQELGHGAQAMRTAEQALRLAETWSAPERIVRALVTLGHILCLEGQYREALAPLREALSLAGEHGLQYERGRALHYLGQAECHCGRLDAAMRTVQEELSIWRDLGLPRREAEALEGLALIYDLRGRSSDSLRALKRALAISYGLNDPMRLAINQYNLACTLVYQHDAQAPQAIKHARQALDCFRAHGHAGHASAALTILGYALWVDGQATAALPVLAEAFEACAAIGEFNRLPELLAYKGLALLEVGDCDASLEVAQRAVLMLAQGEVSQEVVPDIYYALAMAQEAHGRRGAARTNLARAYESLLASAAEIDDAAGRHAVFHHNPTTRRLMRELVAHSMIPQPDEETFSTRLPVGSDRHAVQLRWTVDAGPPDAALRLAHGAIALRRERLNRLLQEAESQGAHPTLGELARALGVSERTVQRYMAKRRKEPDVA